MLENNPQGDPQAGQSSTQNDPQPGGQSAGNGVPANSAPLQDIPENLKGKSTEDVIKMYGELSQKMGQMSGELGQSRDYRTKTEAVLDVILKNPELYSRVDAELKRAAGVSTTPLTTTPPTGDNKNDDKDAREVLENQIINAFADKHGLNGLSAEDKKKHFANLGNELVDIYDPSRTKNPTEVINSIPLKALNGSLEKAMTLYKAKIGPGVLPDTTAAIGSVPSVGLNSGDGISLTNAEKETAKKMHMSEDDYLASKKSLLNSEGV